MKRRSYDSEFKLSLCVLHPKEIIVSDPPTGNVYLSEMVLESVMFILIRHSR
ncbi:hypothetical protein ACFFIS_09815 [Virgibacillus soli]|uniref:hypothetical protein n=1 Tax=Paracerasibacillus soli TaxID=480284 RepID=UPI0035EFD387